MPGRADIEFENLAQVEQFAKRRLKEVRKDSNDKFTIVVRSLGAPTEQVRAVAEACKKAGCETQISEDDMNRLYVVESTYTRTIQPL